MTETWLGTNEAAALLGIEARSVRRNISKEKYQTRQVKAKRGKDGYEIALSSLPEAARKNYENQQQQKELKDLPDWARDRALERLEALNAWEAYAKEKGVGTSKCVQAFIDEHLDGSVTPTTLYRWKKKYKKKGVVGLAPNWRNGREKFSDETFTPAAKRLFYDLYLHQGCGSMKHCLRLVERQAEKRGWNVPSYTTIKRLRREEIPESVEEKERRGKKSYEDHALPYIKRDTSGLRPLEIAEADHHQMDVATIMPDGRIIFPWLTLWIDVDTWKPLAWALVSRPSGDSINISFRELVIRWGIPGNIHIDRGKDFRGKRFLGARKKPAEEDLGKVNQNVNLGIYEALGCKVHLARAYNAKAKVIEPFFNILEKEFGKYMRGYRGKSRNERPDALAGQMKKRNILTFEELKEALYCWLEIEFAELREIELDGKPKQTPNQLFYADAPIKRAVDEDELALLCSPWPEQLTVKQNGVKIRGRWYWPGEEIQHKYQGKKVFVRCVEDDIEKIYLFALDGSFLGTARAKGTVAWNESDAEKYRQQMRYKKSIKEADKAWLEANVGERLTPEQREDLVLARAREKARDFQEPQLQEVQVRTSFFGIVAQAKAAEQERKLAERQLESFCKNYAQIKVPPPQSSSEAEDEYLMSIGRKNDR